MDNYKFNLILIPIYHRVILSNVHQQRSRFQFVLKTYVPSAIYFIADNKKCVSFITEFNYTTACVYV